ncbi:MAG: NFACT RNA binding domain-containing protein [archaeon]
MNEFENYQKYKWFYTSSEKLVIGGKSAVQNDELLKLVKSMKKEYLVIHTSSPGSPFSLILADIKKVSKKDIEEASIFTACFSQCWKSMARKPSVDIFRSSQLYKGKDMKPGTWGVIGDVEEKPVIMSLALTRQQSVLRCVPEQSIKNKKDILVRFKPGKISKEEMVAKLATELGEHFSQSELLNALPAGGFSIIR